MRPILNFLYAKRYAVFLTVLVLFLYIPTLFYGRYMDDCRYLYQHPMGIVQAFKNDRHIQLVYYTSFYLQNLVTMSPIFGHTINIVLYGISLILGWKVAKIFLKKDNVVFVFMLFWVLFPVSAVPVTWISERNDLLTFVFCFLAILTYYKDRFWMSLGCMTIALFCKNTVIFFPLFFVWEHFRQKRYRWMVISGGIFTGVFLLAFLQVQYRLLSGELHLFWVGRSFLVMCMYACYHVLALGSALIFPMSCCLNSITMGIYAGLLGIFSILIYLNRDHLRKPNLDLIVLIFVFFLCFFTTIEFRVYGLLVFFFYCTLFQVFDFSNHFLYKKWIFLVLILMMSVHFVDLIGAKRVFDAREPHCKFKKNELNPNNYEYLIRDYLLNIISKRYPWKFFDKKEELDKIPLFYHPRLDSIF